MAPPQALATFPGIDVITGASMTFSHGITPSVCMIRTIPHTDFVAKVGTLEFSFGKTKITFPDAAVNRASLRVDQQGQRWTMQILDRRWKWQFGEVVGRYNVRLPDGTIDQATRKTPVQLADILLKAMGEKDFEIVALVGQNAVIEATWDHVNPAQELAILADRLGFRIVLNLNSSVSLDPIGGKGEFPKNKQRIHEGFGLTAKPVPSSLRIITAPVRFQSKFILEAVGEDTDGEIKLIDDLSYKPVNGWEKESPLTFPNVTFEFEENGQVVKARDFAVKSVFRWYRVKEQVSAFPGAPLEPNGLRFGGVALQAGKVTKLSEIHLEDVLTEFDLDPEATQDFKPSFLTGTFYSKELADGNTNANTGWPGDFRINRAKGIVELADYAVKVGADGKSHGAAELVLTAGYTLTDSDTGLLIRHILDQVIKVNKHKTEPKLLHRPEIQLTIRETYNVQPDDALEAVNSITNDADVKAAAVQEFDAAEIELLPLETGDITYNGLLAIVLDGAIQQVTWQLGDGAATTRVSRNEEHHQILPNHAERRRRELAVRREEFAPFLEADAQFQRFLRGVGR